jgi:hypothetical protein
MAILQHDRIHDNFNNETEGLNDLKEGAFKDQQTNAQEDAYALGHQHGSLGAKKQPPKEHAADYHEGYAAGKSTQTNEDIITSLDQLAPIFEGYTLPLKLSTNPTSVAGNYRKTKVGKSTADKGVDDSAGILEAKGPCWKGYEQLGMKKKNGKTVPNCVPVAESEKDWRLGKEHFDRQSWEDHAKKNGYTVTRHEGKLHAYKGSEHKGTFALNPRWGALLEANYSTGTTRRLSRLMGKARAEAKAKEIEAVAAEKAAREAKRFARKAASKIQEDLKVGEGQDNSPESEGKGTRVKRKYLGAKRGRTATGKPAHAIDVMPVIQKPDKNVNKTTPGTPLKRT